MYYKSMVSWDTTLSHYWLIKISRETEKLVSDDDLGISFHILCLGSMEKLRRVIGDNSQMIFVTFCQFSIKRMLWVLIRIASLGDSNEYPQHRLNIPSLSVPL